MPRLLSDVLPQSRFSDVHAESRLELINQGLLDWPIDPELLAMDLNAQVAPGGQPEHQLPVQQVQQQPAVQARQLGAQRSVNDLRLPTAEALAAGALPAPPGGATPDMMYRPFPGKHAGLNASKWYHGHPVNFNGEPHWQCAYCKCYTSDENAKRKI
jgi:hypothetical protein